MSTPSKDDPLVEFDLRGDIHVGVICKPSVLSAGNVGTFGEEVLTYVNTHPKLNLVLSFENVDYLSSAVLTELLRIKKAVDALEGRMRLAGVGQMIREIFAITNLDQVFTMDSDSVDAAIRRFHRAMEVEAQDALWQEP